MPVGKYMTKAQTLMAHIKDLENITKIQCADGNWNYDPYMHGMANGMILSLATLQGKQAKYKDAPKRWLKDVSNTSVKTEE